MATKGIKLKDNSGNTILPITHSDLVEVQYGTSNKLLSTWCSDIEQITAEIGIDLNNKLETKSNTSHTHTELSYLWIPMNTTSPKIKLQNNSTTGSYFYQPVTMNIAYASKFFETSDERLKTNIVKLTDGGDVNIYSFKKDDVDSYGFIAQEVQETHPGLVRESHTENGSYLSVDYNSTLSLLLAQAINRIDELENRIKKLEIRL